ncbi:hypothetical protein C5S39_04630 [Candidatus Methanophagaceae archaeon]|jgi:hypothetical protein|nr:hypothetical protein C5S39_04630 [Methanophagales archaeon]
MKEGISKALFAKKALPTKHLATLDEFVIEQGTVKLLL